MSIADPFATHEVFNQSPPFEDVNLYSSDLPLCEAVAREGGAYANGELEEYGSIAGSAHALDLGRLANEHAPTLKPFDTKGRRLDLVEFHPAYHDLMRISTGAGLHCMSFEHLAAGGEPVDGRHVARAAGIYMAQQMESGHCCPITMTNAVIPALLHQPDVAECWLPKLLARDYDPTFQPIQAKSAVTLGMGMTEKQGGTDVRANDTKAMPVKNGGGGKDYEITGHKWFMSAPMCDGFLILAQAPGGLSCFLLPRFRDDGSVNPLRFQRLKDKLGNRSNASSEVEFHKCNARLIGDEGRGVSTIIEMVTYTRFDCIVASAGLMRFALANAMHHASHRTVFQKKLIDQPLMRQVLADMALDVEAATALAFRLARAFDKRDADEGEAAFARLMTPVIKYWICKMVPQFAYEAMECMGGNGYVEEGIMARIYREAPLNAIWEGSGNVMCLDVLRAVAKSPDTLAAVHEELSAVAQGEPALETALGQVASRLRQASELELESRIVVEQLARIAAACILRRDGASPVADAFIASRLGGGWRHTYGQLAGANIGAVLERAAPRK